jgi:flagellar biosynthesis regulator FlbT
MTLTTEQKKQFQKLFRETRPKMLALLRNKEMVETEKLVQVHQEQERILTAVDAILTPEQRTEFREKATKIAQEMQASKPKRPGARGAGATGAGGGRRKP